MSTALVDPSGSVAPSPAANATPRLLPWFPWQKVIIWGLFLAVVYMLRHFFFIMLMTFLICLAMRRTIARLMPLLSPGRPRPWLERLLAVVLFLLLFVGLFAAGNVLGPQVISQGHELLGRLTRMDPEQEFHRLLNNTVGAVLFQNRYGNRYDSRYLAELEKFRAEGKEGLAAFREFEVLLASLEGGFETRFEEIESHRLRTELARSETAGKEFEEWLLKHDAAEKAALAQQPTNLADAPRRKRVSGPKGMAAADTLRGRTDMARLERQWREEVIRRKIIDLKHSPEYEKQFHEYFDAHRKENPGAIPYDYDAYVKLREAHPKGLKVFADTLANLEPGSATATPEQLHQDFQLAREEELATNWWEESPAALAMRAHVQENLGDLASNSAAYLQQAIAYILTVPVQLLTALLISFFITVDFPNLRQSVVGLKATRLRGFYEEIAPGLVSFGQLIGMSFYAQTIVSAFNTLLTFLALTYLGIEHATLLALAVFVCCFIPVFGVILSGIPIALVALFQPGGSLTLALEGMAAVVLVHFIETTVIDPRVFGRMMHLHPVLIVVVLLLAHHFFGLWGLILGVPVTVYLVRHVILNEPVTALAETSAGGTAATAVPPTLPPAPQTVPAALAPSQQA